MVKTICFIFCIPKKIKLSNCVYSIEDVEFWNCTIPGEGYGKGGKDREKVKREEKEKKRNPKKEAGKNEKMEIAGNIEIVGIMSRGVVGNARPAVCGKAAGEY